MDAFLVIDVQNDFCPGGALAVPDGDEVVPVINDLLPSFEIVVQTQDWHPEGHYSFASTHQGRDTFETVKLDYGEQVLWPDHCVKGTHGADFHPDLDTRFTQEIIRKGFRREIDSYSAFFENDKQTPTGLSGYLQERGTVRLFLAGLATDFCVKWSALDGVKKGFEVYVIEDAVRGIDQNGSLKKAWHEMDEAGVRTVSADQVDAVRR